MTISRCLHCRSRAEKRCVCREEQISDRAKPWGKIWVEDEPGLWYTQMYIIVPAFCVLGERQNEYFTNVYAGIQDMTQLLGVAADAVSAMGEAHNKQATVIQSTVSINKEIADDISNENTQFQSINGMVESNVNDIAEMSNQINTINQMVDEINNLLKREE